MGACERFEFSIPGDVRDFFGKLGLMVAEHQGTLNGDETGGTFSVSLSIVGTIEGRYSVSGQMASVQITRRPFLLPCKTIESFVKSRVPSSG